MPVSERTKPTGPFSNVAEYPFAVWCDANPDCNFRVVEKTYEAGVAALTVHKCPYTGGRTKIGILVSLSQLIEAWEKLDSAVVELMEGSYPPEIRYDAADRPEEFENEDKVRLKGVCRGMAELIALFMGTEFPDADAVSAEAAKRYKAKKEGVEHLTPGLEPRSIATPRTVDYKDGVNKGGGKPVTQPRNPAPSPVHKFTEEEVGSIKFAHESGMFTVEQLAKTYKVKVDAIKKVLES